MPAYIDYSDNDLLLFLKQGDAHAFNEIYSRNWQQLYQTAYRRLKDQELCKDIIHDVFADLWNKCAEKEIDDLQPYLHTAVRYKIYTLLAKGNAAPHFVEPFEDMAVSPVTADGWLQAHELERLIGLWLDTLPKKRQQIFKMRYQENLSTKAISEQLNISQKTVQNQLLNSFSGLRGYLSHYLTVLVVLGFFNR